MKLTETNIIVYCIDTEKLLKKVTQDAKGYLKENDSLITPPDGIITVNGGYLLVNSDCCYQESQTQLRQSGGSFEILERFNIGFTILTKNGDFSKYGLRFSTYIDCAVLIKKYCLTGSKTLRSFMGRRYNYNPRVSKNMRELIEVINTLQENDK